MNRNVVELVNRTDRDFKFMYDGIQYTVPANGELDVTEDTATHARKKSIMRYDLETGRAEYQVGIRGQHDISDLGKGKLAEEELIDRSTDILGKPKTINVRGGQVAESRETDALAG